LETAGQDNNFIQRKLPDMAGDHMHIDSREESLRQSEEYYRSLFRENQSVMLLIDPQSGSVVDANPAAAEFYGWTEEELRTKNITEINTLTAEDVRVAMQRAIEKNRRHFVFRHRLANGEVRDVEVFAGPITRGNSRLLYSIVHDISDRTKAESQLREQQQLYRGILDASPDAVTITDLKGMILLVSPMSMKMFGYATESDLLGHSIIDFIAPGDRERAISNFAGMFTGERPGPGEYLGLRVDGSTFDVEVNGEFIRDDAGVPASMVFITRDTTLRKRAEKELTESQQRFQGAFENSPMGMALVSTEGKWLRVNETLCSIVGYNEKELLERSFEDLTHPDYLLNDVGYLNRLLAGEIPNYSADKKYIHKSGSEIWVQINVSLMRDSAGNPLYFITHVEDISERKRSESELLSSTNLLSNLMINLQEGILLEDSNRKIILINQLFCDLFNIPVDPLHLVGADCTGAAETNKVLFTNPEAFVEGIEMILRYRLPVLNEVFELNDGRRFERDFIPNYIGDQYSGHLWKYRDITVQWRVQEEVRNLNAELEQRIERRTAQLTEINLSLQKEIDERKRVEIALRESELNYSEVVENVTEVIFQTDLTGAINFLNKAWERIMGFTIRESLGRNFLEFVHSDDRELSLDLFRSLMSGERPSFMNSVRCFTKAGGIRWVEVLARAGQNESGDLSGTFGTIRDVTEKKRGEELEDEMLRLSLQLTGISGSEISQALNLSLSRIGSFLGADRAYLFEAEDPYQTWWFTHEWHSEGLQPAILIVPQVDSSVMPRLLEKFKNHENVIIGNPLALDDSWAAERDRMLSGGVKSAIMIPIIIENSLVGFVGLDYIRQVKEPAPSEVLILQVWSNMLASLINNRRKEVLLDQTRFNYETFFNTIDDFLFVLDTDANIIQTNDTVTERLGYSISELVGRSVLMVHPEERRDEAARIVGEMLGGSADFCPVPLVTKSGLRVPVETRVKQGHWNGMPVLFGVSKDVSKIQLSEEKFSKAFRSNSALMAISGFEDGKFIDINDTFLETLGFSREDVLGHTAGQLRLFREQMSRHEIGAKLAEKSSVRDFEVVVSRRDGSSIIGLFSAELIYVGKDLCFLTMLVDITARKMAEEEARLARIEAEKANLAKSEFLSRMSHELRTPLNSILGFAQLLEMGDLSPSQKKGIGHILVSGNHLLNLINEVLDISSIEAGHLQLTPELLQVGSLIREMMEIVEPLANKLNLTLSVSDSPANAYFIRTDNQRVRQVLLNLLSNAIKYNREGGSVSVSTALRPAKDGDMPAVRISVRDTGIGISKEDQPKLFRPFERIGAEQRGTEGSGLGLAVVKKLIDAMGGAIHLESEPGKGSEFTIDLPYAENPDHPVPVAGVFVPPKQFRDKTGLILYIEDDLLNIELVRQILDNHYPRVKLVSSITGKEAVLLAREFKPDLILLDLNLPDTHGVEVLGRLQAEEYTQGIPVVVVTADAMPDQISRLLGAGARKYLSKPLDVHEFVKVVTEYLDHGYD
jgi:PAS domain S-box-containing protein